MQVALNYRAFSHVCFHSDHLFSPVVLILLRTFNFPNREGKQGQYSNSWILELDKKIPSISWLCFSLSVFTNNLNLLHQESKVSRFYLFIRNVEQSLWISVISDYLNSGLNSRTHQQMISKLQWSKWFSEVNNEVHSPSFHNCQSACKSLSYWLPCISETHVSLKQNVYNKWTIYTYINTVQYMVVDIDEDGIEYIW